MHIKNGYPWGTLSIILFALVSCQKNDDNILPRTPVPMDTVNYIEFIGLTSGHPAAVSFHKKTASSDSTILTYQYANDLVSYSSPTNKPICLLYYLGSVLLFNTDSIKGKTGYFVYYAPDTSLLNKPVIAEAVRDGVYPDTLTTREWVLSPGLVGVSYDSSSMGPLTDGQLSAQYNSGMANMNYNSNYWVN